MRPEARQLQALQTQDLSLLSNARARLRFAIIATVAVVAVLAFIVFPPHHFSVNADGRQIDVVTRERDLVSLLDDAGVQRDPGDVLVKSHDRIVVERAIPAVVEVDGKLLTWRTRAATVQAMLDEMNVSVSPYDALILNGREVSPGDSINPGPVQLAALPGAAGGVLAEPISADGVKLEVKRAVPLTVTEDGLEVTLQTSRATLAEVLRDAGIRLGPADEIYPAPSTPVTSGMDVQIKHAKSITLHIGSSTQVLYTQQKTLQAALEEAGLTFGEEDRTDPPLDAAVSNGMEARLVRVSGQQILEKEPVQHVTVFKPDESLSGSQTRRVEGSDGVHVSVYHVRIEDGEEVEKTFERDYFDPEVVDTVIYYAPSSLNSTGIDPASLSIKDTLRMHATWYNAASSGKAATSSSYGITKSGAPLTKGIVAVDPAVIPLGTRLFIPGYGFAVAGDTGGGIKGNMIDLGFPDGVAVDWNTGWTDVYILAP